MFALLTVFVAVLISLLVTRVATVALTLTGLSRESARFQARSALSGAGFTTSESEAVVNHPIRRRVVMMLMLVGSVGIVTVIGTFFLSFANVEEGQRNVRLLVLVGGLTVIWLLARSAVVDRRLSRLIALGLRRWTDLDARDYAALLRLADNFAVIEIAVRNGDWVEGHTLGELELRDEGVLVIGISRPGGEYIGVPAFDTELRERDVLLIYGPSERICEIDDRQAGPKGDAAHEQAVTAAAAEAAEQRARG